MINKSKKKPTEEESNDDDSTTDLDDLSWQELRSKALEVGMNGRILVGISRDKLQPRVQAAIDGEPQKNPASAEDMSYGELLDYARNDTDASVSNTISRGDLVKIYNGEEIEEESTEEPQGDEEGDLQDEEEGEVDEEPEETNEAPAPPEEDDDEGDDEDGEGDLEENPKMPKALKDVKKAFGGLAKGWHDFVFGKINAKSSVVKALVKNMKKLVSDISDRDKEIIELQERLIAIKKNRKNKKAMDRIITYMEQQGEISEFKRSEFKRNSKLLMQFLDAQLAALGKSHIAQAEQLLDLGKAYLKLNKATNVDLPVAAVKGMMKKAKKAKKKISPTTNPPDLSEKCPQYRPRPRLNPQQRRTAGGDDIEYNVDYDALHEILNRPLNPNQIQENPKMPDPLKDLQKSFGKFGGAVKKFIFGQAKLPVSFTKEGIQEYKKFYKHLTKRDKEIKEAKQKLASLSALYTVSSDEDKEKLVKAVKKHNKSIGMTDRVPDGTLEKVKKDVKLLKDYHEGILKAMVKAQKDDIKQHIALGKAYLKLNKAANVDFPIKTVKSLMKKAKELKKKVNYVTNPPDLSETDTPTVCPACDGDVIATRSYAKNPGSDTFFKLYQCSNCKKIYRQR